jgi:hypothetical protein
MVGMLLRVLLYNGRPAELQAQKHLQLTSVNGGAIRAKAKMPSSQSPAALRSQGFFFVLDAPLHIPPRWRNSFHCSVAAKQ